MYEALSEVQTRSLMIAMDLDLRLYRAAKSLESFKEC